LKLDGQAPTERMMMTEILTIGHSNHDIGAFLAILKKHGIDVLVDIRSDPYSRYATQFNKAEFQHAVTQAGIQYLYSGAQLGGKPRDVSLYTASGKPDYDKLASTDEFQAQLRRLVEIAATKRLVIMCSEADPMSCHRERIIAPVLRSWGVEVRHILPDGTLESAQQFGLF